MSLFKTQRFSSFFSRCPRPPLGLLLLAALLGSIACQKNSPDPSASATPPQTALLQPSQLPPPPASAQPPSAPHTPETAGATVLQECVHDMWERCLKNDLECGALKPCRALSIDLSQGPYPGHPFPARLINPIEHLKIVLGTSQDADSLTKVLNAHDWSGVTTVQLEAMIWEEYDEKPLDGKKLLWPQALEALSKKSRFGALRHVKLHGDPHVFAGRSAELLRAFGAQKGHTITYEVECSESSMCDDLTLWTKAAAIPGLETITMTELPTHPRGIAPLFGSPLLSTLRTLVLTGGGDPVDGAQIAYHTWKPQDVNLVAKSPHLANLESLELTYGRLNASQIATLGRAKNMPALRELMLVGVVREEADEDTPENKAKFDTQHAAILKALAEAPLLSQLRTLGLGSTGTNTPKSLAPLVASPYTQNIKTLNFPWSSAQNLQEVLRTLAAMKNLELVKLHDDSDLTNSPISVDRAQLDAAASAQRLPESEPSE